MRKTFTERTGNPALDNLNRCANKRVRETIASKTRSIGGSRRTKKANRKTVARVFEALIVEALTAEEVGR